MQHVSQVIPQEAAIQDRTVNQRLIATAAKHESALQKSKKSSLRLTQAMTTLWARMGEIFGAKWVNQYGDLDGSAFETWTQVLHDLEPAQIKQGFINLCRDNPQFIPDALEFREYCVSMASFGLPPERQAYLEAMHHAHEWQTWKWSHHAVYVALKLSGIADMRRLTEKESAPIFYRNYKIVCRKVMAGLPYEEPIPLAIPESVPEYLSPGENLERCQALKELLA